MGKSVKNSNLKNKTTTAKRSAANRRSSSKKSSKKRGTRGGFKFENLFLCVVVLTALGFGIMFFLQDERPLEQPIDIAEASPAEQAEPPEPLYEPNETAPPESPIQEPPPSEEAEQPEEPEPPEDEPPAETPFNIRRVEQLDLPDDVVSPFNVNFGSPFDGDGRLSNTTHSWYFMRNANHQPPIGNRAFDIRTLNGIYLGDISQRVVYLTFDAGYEYGFTEQILNTLAEKNVQAAFFVTLPYVRSNPELIRRKVQEGHLIANHSVTHRSSPALTDEEFEFEIMELQRYFEENFDAQMGRFFRPPMGEFSARTLALTDNLGYKTVFWSFAYQDWLVDNQPGADFAYQIIMNNLHNGSIILLHSVSESNTQALPYVIDSIRAQGYRFASLLEIGS